MARWALHASLVLLGPPRPDGWSFVWPVPPNSEPVSLLCIWPVSGPIDAIMLARWLRKLWIALLVALRTASTSILTVVVTAAEATAAPAKVPRAVATLTMLVAFTSATVVV